METKEFTHFNQSGRSHMVDVGDKEDTLREATAKGSIKMNPETVEMIKQGRMKKGDVLSVAQVAGILGLKKTSDLIPMCHNIPITASNIEFEIKTDEIIIEATAKTYGKTGIEMEVITAVSICALTIYDMCKAVDKNMEITNIRVTMKTGGKSGTIINE